MQFVINEWIWEDIRGNNQEQAQREAVELLEGFIASDHKLVVIEGSAFDTKFWGCCSHTDAVTRDIARGFLTGVRINLDRCNLIAPENAAEIPDSLASVKPDDQYLVRALLTVPGSVLVTTDADLLATLTRAGVRCMTREEFLALLK